MKATDLIEVLRLKAIYGEPLANKEISLLVNDTRKIIPNCCYIAIRGEHFDGHQAIEQAVEAGANVVVVEEYREAWQNLNATIILVDSTFRAQAILANQFYNRPSEKLAITAITGTNGKTTTSSMISDWLTRLGHKTGLLGTLHYKVNENYYPAVNTTPNALELQRLFNEMVVEGCQDAIIEASSHALQLGRLWYTEVDCAIFTNLTREHLDFHHTMEHYAYAKSLLFAQLGQKFANGRPKLAIVNLDDEYGQLMAQASAAEVATYSIGNADATVYATDIEVVDNQTEFKLWVNQRSHQVSLKMLGDYNVANYMAAFLCLKYYYGYSTEEIIRVSGEFEGVSGRMQLVDEGQPYKVVVDFAHTPDAIENVLKELAAKKQGRLITLIGHSGGNRDSGARPEIGDIVFKYSDYIVFTADNPRHEPVQKICQEIIGQHNEVDYTIIEKREEAIAFALNHANEHDTVVFTGKGGELYQVIGDDYVPYNEVEVIKATLRKNK